MLNFDLQHLFSFTAKLRFPAEVVGPIPEGIRLMAYVIEGSVDGPRVRGKLLPVGGDWLLLRTDGVGMVDVRITLQTNDDALIYMSYTGVIDLGTDGYQRFLAGDIDAKLPIRTAPRFATGHADYAWLNRLQCYAIGEADTRSSTVSYDVYAAL